MATFAQILPLAITMMAGPQIISDIIIITGKDPQRPSLAFVAAVGLAATTGTAVLFIVFSLIGIKSLAGSGKSPVRQVETALVTLLIAMAVRTFLKRAEIKAPKWMEALQEATPGQAFKLGLTLILVMPSDLVIMITVAFHLISRGAPFVDALPFVALTVAVAGLPLALYTLFQRRAVEFMPGVREWLNNNSWLVQIGVYIIFIFLIWN